MARQNHKAALLALSIGAATLLTFSSGAAAKSPELYFYPAKSWTVGTAPMQVANTNVQSCSIRNEFNNGFIMRFDGSHKWVQAMRIDFRQQAFNAGAGYNVSMSVPGKVTKTMKANASQSNVLTVDLENQKDLYQAMRDAAVLDLSVDGNEFRFYMTGFTGAAANFERCMAGGSVQQPSQGRTLQASMSDAPGATTNEAIAYEQAEREGVSIVEILPDNPQPVVQEIPVKETHRLGDQIVEQKMPTDVAHIRQDKQKRMTEMLAEKIDQNPDIIAMEELSRPGETTKPLAPLPPLELPPGMDERPAKTAKAPNKPPMETGTEITTAETVEELLPVEPVAPALAPVTIPKTPKVEVSKRTSQIEADFTDLPGVEPASDSMSFDSPRDPELAKKISQLENMIFTLEKENEALNSELKSALAESEGERLSISSDNWNLERATMRFNEAERQIKRLGTQLQRERAQCAVERKELEAMLFDPQVTNEQQLAHLADLEGKLKETRKKLEDQRLRYEERIRILETQTLAN